MACGVAHVTDGIACETVKATVDVAELKSAVSVGVKVTDNGWDPAFKTAPDAGVYANVPAVFALAFSCVLDRAVP